MLACALALWCLPAPAAAFAQDSVDASSSPAASADATSSPAASQTDRAELLTAAALAGADGDATLPSRFDLRDEGVVGPVRNQNPWGACWAFATMAASETSILSELGTTFDESPLTLSPRHLAWFAATALPDAATMAASESLAPYASQAGEGTTVRPVASNDFGSVLELGGFTFESATMLAAGVGPVLEQQAPYRNDENMAEVKDSEPVAQLEHGQTIQDFLAEHPGEYNGYSELDENGNPSFIVVARVKVTQALVAAGKLANYAMRPAFDDEGHLIVHITQDTPRYEWGLSESQRFSRVFELEAYRALPTPTGGYAGQDYHYDEAATDAIKRELLAGRGVAISMFEDNVQEDRGYAYYTNPETWSQYTVDTSGANKVQGAAHAVCIVGWDDNWAVSNFKSGTITADDGSEVSMAPPGPGAWIVRNSYGSEDQEFPNAGTVGYRDENGLHTGYYYVSYYDMSITRPSSFDFDVSGHLSDYINQYDLMPAPVPYTEEDLGTRFANVFTASADQYVHALSVETEEPNTHARLELWKLDANGSAGDALAGGEPVASVEADLEYGGLYRLDLATSYLVHEGERFAVVGQLTTAGDDGATTYHAPVHRDVNESSIEKYGDAISSYVTGVVNAGESFLERDGSWTDWKDAIAQGKADGSLVSYYDYDNFSVRAYADAAGSEPDDRGSKGGDERDNKNSGANGANGRTAHNASTTPNTGDPLSLATVVFPLVACAACAACTAVGALIAHRRTRAK